MKKVFGRRTSKTFLSLLASFPDWCRPSDGEVVVVEETTFGDGDGVNLINELPDHILVSVISLLDLKQAAQTSILSRAWVKLWTHTRRLVFEDTTTLEDFDYDECSIEEEESLFEAKRSSFVNRVNTALKSHQGTTLDEFTVTVCFDLKSCKLDIDSWISFALEKRAECLHLDFDGGQSNELLLLPEPRDETYTLTIQFLSDFRTINFLKVVRFVSLNLSGEVVEYILSACPLLEVLKVQNSKSLVRLRVSGTNSLNLKSLEIVCCPLEYIEIVSATNLVSFSYEGRRPKGIIKNVPNLVELSLSGECAYFLVDNNDQFSGFLSGLETFVLDLKSKGLKSFPEFPEMEKLKHLELLLDGSLVESLLFCADLLEGSPLLHRLTLKFSWPRSRGKSTFVEYCGDMEEQEEPEPELVHKHLELIEFIGFKGGAMEVELLLCLLGRAVSLKRLIIEPWCENIFGEIYKNMMAAIIAKQLETRLPPLAELVILY